jgi:hypothetical protein
VGPQLPCPCGGSAQYHGRHGKTFESVLGPLQLQRAYYHCEHVVRARIAHGLQERGHVRRRCRRCPPPRCR